MGSSWTNKEPEKWRAHVSRCLNSSFLQARTAMLFSLPRDLQFKIFSELDCKQCAQLMLLSKRFQKLVQESWSASDIVSDRKRIFGAIGYLGNHCSQVIRCLKIQEDKSKATSVAFRTTGERERISFGATFCARICAKLQSVIASFTVIVWFSYGVTMFSFITISRIWPYKPLRQNAVSSCPDLLERHNPYIVQPI